MVSLGDEPISKEVVQEHIERRKIQDGKRLENMREQDASRFKPEFNREAVFVEVDRIAAMEAEPAWDILANNHFSTRRKLMDLIVKAANKVLIRIRAQKRLDKLKKLFRKNQIRTRANMKEFVIEENKTAMLKGGEGTGESDDIRSLKFSFNFQPKTFQFTRLPLEYDATIQGVLEFLETDPPIDFEKDDM
jgi:hypothetical protein